MAKNSRRARRTDEGPRRTRQSRETIGADADGGRAQLRPDPERPRGWTLLLDGAPQSHVDLDDPGHLEFDYQRRLGHVADLAAPAGQPLNVLHLGGGALALARYVAATRPRSAQQVLERDVRLTALVREHLPTDPADRIRVRGADAREGLARIRAGWADLVLADVFAGARTPAHLTSTEFLTEVHRVLRPGGSYAANLTDGPSSAGGTGRLTFLRSQAATAREVFAYTALAAPPALLRGRHFGNAVLLASDAEPPLAALTRRMAAGPHTARLEHGRALDEFTGRAAPVTDASAVPSPLPPEGTFG